MTPKQQDTENDIVIQQLQQHTPLIAVQPQQLQNARLDPNNDDDELDQVLQQEEQQEMDDEEIESYDEDGQPIVDLAQLERRNLTVALVKSVVDTSGAKPPLQRNYGLRHRRRDPPEADPPVPSQPPPAAAAAAMRQPPILPPPAAPPIRLLRTTPTPPPPPLNVPNPLKHNLSPPQEKPPVTTTRAPVPCPLPAIKEEPVMPMPRGRIFSMDIDPEGLDFPDMGMDIILTAQPDLTASSTILPPMASLHTLSRQQHGQSQQPPLKQPAAAPVPMFASSSSYVGRDRAMSFEFFSFGINADEPSLPVPEQEEEDDESVDVLGRPRGDSIIFDPCSFRDGGIHEEKALYRSRTSSIDLPSADELAIMNSPGFPSQQQLQITHEPNPTPMEVPSSSSCCPATTTVVDSTTTTQMATLPSSLNHTMNHHATFQMDLLNKDGRIGIYLPDARRARIAKFHSKRQMRIWKKRIKYDCRKKLADSRPRIKGRFVKRSDMDDDEEE